MFDEYEAQRKEEQAREWNETDPPVEKGVKYTFLLGIYDQELNETVGTIEASTLESLQEQFRKIAGMIEAHEKKFNPDMKLN